MFSVQLYSIYPKGHNINRLELTATNFTDTRENVGSIPGSMFDHLIFMETLHGKCKKNIKMMQKCIYNSKDGFKKWNHLPQVKPHWFWGNRPIFSKSLKDIVLDHYSALGDHRFGLYWILNLPSIFIKDRELIKRVQVVDFDHFTDLGKLEALLSQDDPIMI